MAAAALAALAALAAGCDSSSFELQGDAPATGDDPASVQRRFDAPDGTLSANNAEDLLKQGRESLTAFGSFDVSGSGGGAGAVSTKSVGLHPLDSSGTSSLVECLTRATSDSGTCDCTKGGTLAYSRQTSRANGVTESATTYTLAACDTGVALIDGTESTDVKIDTSDSQHPIASVFLSVDVDLTTAGASHHVTASFRLANGAIDIAVKTDDGYVVVTFHSSKAGTDDSWTVRDKNGTWTCTGHDGHGTCKSDGGATTSF